jgi:hypothetical protein
MENEIDLFQMIGIVMSRTLVAKPKKPRNEDVKTFTRANLLKTEMSHTIKICVLGQIVFMLYISEIESVIVFCLTGRERTYGVPGR